MWALCGKERKAAQRNLFSTAELIFVNHIIQINNPKKYTTLALPTSKPSLHLPSKKSPFFLNFSTSLFSLSKNNWV
jgi:hypothetical protein